VVKIRHLDPLKVSGFLITLTLLFTATVAQAAGFRFIEVPVGPDGPALTGAIWSPCSAAPGEIDLGNVTLPGVKDCPIGGDKLPLVVISHGRRGSFVGHHDIAEALADAGFVVAAINHPGDTAPDTSRSDDLSVFIERPNDIKRLIDFMIGASPAAANIDPGRIGFFGFPRRLHGSRARRRPSGLGPRHHLMRAILEPYLRANPPQRISGAAAHP
jgi:predicted dienelactone hydrolase